MTLPPNPFNGRISQDELADYDGDLLAPVIDMNQPQGRRNKKIPLSAIVSEAAEQAQADRNHCIIIGFEGGGEAIPADRKRRFFVPFNIRITQAVLEADDDVTAELDIWVAPFSEDAADIPTIADTICGATPPTLTAKAGSSDAALSDWTVDIVAGSTVVVNVNSNDAAQELSLTLWVIEPAE